MGFLTSLLILTNSKRDNYNFILVIIDRLTKMMHNKPIKITIDALDLAKSSLMW